MATNPLALLHTNRRPPESRLRKTQPGPVTLAIRAMRRNEAPSWEARQAQIDAQERAALHALRLRIDAQFAADAALLEGVGA